MKKTDSGKTKKESSRGGGPFWVLLFALSIFVTFASVGKITDILLERSRSSGEYKKLEEIAVSPAASTAPGDTDPVPSELPQETPVPDPKPPVTVDMKQLRSDNPDIIAWLYCEGTNINYPVMQDDDNDFYISHLPDGTENASGSLFADARNSSDFSDPYTFIHGHNMSDGSMFGKLSDFSTQEFYDHHPYMFLFTEDKVYRVDLVSGFTASYEGRFFYLDGSEDARQDLINTAYSSSYFESKSDAPSEDEKLLVLSTCAYQYETARFILLGVLREVKE